MNNLVLYMLVAVTIGMIIYFLKRKQNTENLEISSDLSIREERNVSKEFLELIPKIEQIDLVNIHQNNLIKIEDPGVISKINASFPKITSIATNSILKKGLKNSEKILNDGNVYKVIIPSGSVLDKSKSMPGAFRATIHTGPKFSGQANLKKIDTSKINNLNEVSNIASVANNVMNVASMVVGQYYMAEIDNKMAEINDNLNKIVNFQDREYKSRVISIFAKVKKISNFSTDLMDNDEIRFNAINSLNRYEDEVVVLLQQANITINDLTNQGKIKSLEDYQGIVTELNVYTNYQKYLILTLEEISRLSYILHKGMVDEEMSFSIYKTYFEQTIETRNKLIEWHKNQSIKLNILLNENKIEKGSFGKFLGTVNINWRYKELPPGMQNIIVSQMEEIQNPQYDNSMLLKNDVEIIIKDGEYYYHRNV